jgi:hypothetical protein
MVTMIISKEYHQKIIQRLANFKSYASYNITQKLDFICLHFPEYREQSKTLLAKDLLILWP